ncbi:hypothetical protein DEO72_LG10g2545 [Vigna unguiculata]|uniref:Uncharacterized protein n=1 Tax=Vigna unguiculata TaxID=3917 RepID=A0A4D6NEJ4_VIGUN|nr:hypothetical protein DEO72_LG10g2545 [Vigna unguiculata]
MHPFLTNLTTQSQSPAQNHQNRGFRATATGSGKRVSREVSVRGERDGGSVHDVVAGREEDVRGLQQGAPRGVQRARRVASQGVSSRGEGAGGRGGGAATGVREGEIIVDGVEKQRYSRIKDEEERNLALRL